MPTAEGRAKVATARRQLRSPELVKLIQSLTFVGEEYPLTIGGETFDIDWLFFHRRRHQSQNPRSFCMAPIATFRSVRVQVGNPPLHKLNFSPARTV